MPVYIFTFGTALGRTRTIRVNHADESLSDAQVRAAANGLISSQAFWTQAGGLITNARRAVLQKVTTTPITLV